MYPSTFSTFPRPSTTSRLNNPSHSDLHNQISSAIGQIEAVIGKAIETDPFATGTIISDLRSPSSNGGGHIQSVDKGGTGNTSYVKGDILVAQSSSNIVRLAVGADGTGLVADSATASGVKWGSAGAVIVSSTIAVSSVWTKPSAALPTSRVFVELWGGGGSGGAAAANNEAGGGGGGGYASGWFSASILSSVLINVGRGGDSRLAGGDGFSGGITVWNPQTSLLTAFGGGGGAEDAIGAAGGGGGGTYQNGNDATVSTNAFTGGSSGGGVTIGDGTQVVSLGYRFVPSIYGIPQQGGGGGFATQTSGNPIASNIGGNAIYGGAGGGSMSSSTLGGSCLGGISTFGGNGGNGQRITTGSAMAGFIPGGGGGAAHGPNGVVSSGPGAVGMAKITVFI